jgi:hypothetical protein
MARSGRTVCAALIFSLLLILPCSAKNILVWKNSGPSEFPNPEKKGAEPELVGCEYGLQQAIIQNKNSCTVVEELPEDLSPYDMVFITLGMAFLEEG